MICLIRKFYILLLALFVSFCTSVGSVENRIIYKINNEIITSFDLNKEFRYLNLINPKITNLDKNEIFEISKNSIIREKIKKIEILNHIKKIKLDDDFLNQLIENTYVKIGVKNKKELKNKLQENLINFEEFKEKLAIEALWNQLIYEKYYTKVKIDKDDIKKQISSKKKQNLFNLSEIVFNVEGNNDLKDKLKSIKNDIENKGFENSALKHSISESKSLGGNIGWINENSINQNLRVKINELQVGDYTQPQVIPGGFIILKLNEIKETTISLDIEKEMKMLIRLKTNQQLNQFSNIYFNKVKKNVKIEKI